MSRNEVDEVFIKYGIYDYDGVEVGIFDDGKEIEKLIQFLRKGRPVPFEHPDSYIREKNRILIIEHFAIDGYVELPNGGSELLRNESKLTKAFSKLPAAETGVHLSQLLGTYNSYSGFIENCKRRFEQHYSQIDAYKKHLHDEGIADDETEFTVCFLMDDISPLGTLAHDGERVLPVCLAKSKEFLDFYMTHPCVDWVISAVFLLKGYAPYFFSYNKIGEYREQTLEYSSYQFFSSNPMRTDFKALIPKESLWN